MKNMKKAEIVLAGAATLIAFTPAANAQSLQTYFNLTTYNTVSAGSSIVDSMGNTHATLNNDSITTLTSSGLTSAGGGNSGNNGLTFASGSLSGFTGSFTIQDWVTTAGGSGVVLYGGNGINQGASTGLPAAQNTYCGDGFTGVSTLLGLTWGGLTSGGGAGNATSTTYQRYGQTGGLGYSLVTGSLSDIVLSYDASTYTFKEYVNGVLKGTQVNDFSITSLAGVEVFAIGGAPGQPWSDASAAATTSDFLLYNGALSQSQVTALDALGAGASLGQIGGIVTVPEPGSLALMALGGAGLLLWRRRQASPQA
jgi:hypothetical protein